MSEDNLILRPKGRIQGEDGYKVFSIRIRNELADRIGDIAERTGYSRNELIGIFLGYALDRCVIQEKD